MTHIYLHMDHQMHLDISDQNENKNRCKFARGLSLRHHSKIGKLYKRMMTLDWVQHCIQIDLLYPTEHDPREIPLLNISQKNLLFHLVVELGQTLSQRILCNQCHLDDIIRLRTKHFDHRKIHTNWYKNHLLWVWNLHLLPKKGPNLMVLILHYHTVSITM